MQENRQKKNKSSAEWNVRMIKADKKTNKKEGKPAQRIKVAVLDSGIDWGNDINLAYQVSLVPDEEEMTQIFIDTTQNPNMKKVENAKALSNSIEMLKELICINLMNDTGKIIYESELYQKAVYGNIYTNSNYNYKFELLKERLWKYPIWRTFVKTAKKILRKS